MSSILKALKKLEQEKAARKPDSFRIDSEILRGNVQRRPIATRASLAAITLFLCGVGVTYLVMRHDRASGPPQPRAATIEIKGETSSAVTPLPMSRETMAETQTRLPEKKSSATDARLPAIQPSGKQQALTQKPADTLLKPSPPPEPNPATPTAPAPPPLPAPVKPVLRVLGIAYQEGAESAAVINGVTVTKGAVIEGARVEEIQKDHVKFSRGAEKFEIFLDRSN